MKQTLLQTVLLNKKSKTVIVIAICLFVYSFSSNNVSAQSTYGNIKLLPGYKYKKEDGMGVLSSTGTIYRDSGLKIEFEEGLSQGYAVDKVDTAKYLWFKEQTINGQKVRLAFIKKGIKTGWEPDKPRNSAVGNILLVTYPLSDQLDHAINFRAEILTEEEMADALLMILTFNPKEFE